jgi:hypothetical protein
LQQQPAKAILVAPYQGPKASEWLHSRTAIPIVTLPYTVDTNAEEKSLFNLFDSIVSKLLAVITA